MGNLSIKQVNLQLDNSCPNELIRSCFIGVLCNRTVTDISLEASSEFCEFYVNSISELIIAT